MPDRLFDSLKFSFVESILDVKSEDWQAIVNCDYPFIQYPFLSALEKSGAVCEATGWRPCHLLVTDKNTLIAVMPMYIKKHSYGEYIFDFQWADAFHRSGTDYYPKLIVAIPFTPSSGPRLCIDKSFYNKINYKKQNNNRINQDAFYFEIIQAIKSLCIEKQLSSCHILFSELTESLNWNRQLDCTRLGIQYHWFNQDYQSFDDFLSACKPKQRKNIKRERRIVKQQGIVIKVFQSDEITPEIWQHLFAFYQLTYAKRSGHAGYLNKDFFNYIANDFSKAALISVAFLDNKIIAASLFFKNNTILYGRYWGCIKEFDCLHFELCYYQGIDYCIKHQLKKFDAGAQGEHKISRGFKPIETYSNHWIANQIFAEPIQKFVQEESKYIKQAIDAYSEKLPYK